MGKSEGSGDGWIPSAANEAAEKVEKQIPRGLKGLLKESAMRVPRGLKSTRNIKNKGLSGTTEVMP